ncbi:hypothetical protein BM221_008504 [Beauveria bassiana]|uniref:Uncharacterized protein n=1 Tax=Beauveria bassiana TaxID=176275 RepID=A0A2N6NCZ7_BEABA|nr:hypothetical protein BM221_008504 [Beauveria bassiana]
MRISRRKLRKALALQDRQQQVKELTEISILAKALPRFGSEDNSDDEQEGDHSARDSADDDNDDSGDNNRILRRNALFALHGTRFEDDIRKGIADLEKTAVKQQVPMISRLIEYRAREGQDLSQIFQDSDATTTDSKQARWESQIGNATAITVAQETGARLQGDL